MDRGAWWAVIHTFTRIEHDLTTYRLKHILKKYLHFLTLLSHFMILMCLLYILMFILLLFIVVIIDFIEKQCLICVLAYLSDH